MLQPECKLRCQRIGCDSTFTEDDNQEGSCRYHDSLAGYITLLTIIIPGTVCILFFVAGNFCFDLRHQGPIFHDGMKEWSCCRKRSHDFSLFLEIPGCKAGKHTTEKPVLAKPAPKITTRTPSPASAITTNPTSTEACSRCKLGAFCSDHGSAPVSVKEEFANVVCPPKKIVGINEPQVCKNKGCGKTFKEKDNHDSACEYHPGPAVFHDRLRGWKCCDVHVKEFDEFMSIPPCTRGWHNADPAS